VRREVCEKGAEGEWKGYLQVVREAGGARVQKTGGIARLDHSDGAILPRVLHPLIPQHGRHALLFVCQRFSPNLHTQFNKSET
jgi:hypothetical protein